MFLIFFNMKVYCVFSVESPHRGDSKEYTQYISFNILKKISLNYPKSAAIGFFFKGLKDKFETAVVNEPSVFEPLKFYCSWSSHLWYGTGTDLNQKVIPGLALLVCYQLLQRVS